LRKSPQAQTLTGKDRFSPGALQGHRRDDRRPFQSASSWRNGKPDLACLLESGAIRPCLAEVVHSFKKVTFGNANRLRDQTSFAK
jgi:hypothetical protein